LRSGQFVIRAVSTLFFSRRPSAIRRRVITVIVDALQGQAFRALTHVAAEVLESFWTEPALANYDSALPVPPRHWMLEVETSLPHCVKRLVS
jgi:hypothetical protein